MRKIIPQLTDELKKVADPREVSASDGILVASFRELIEHCAQLSYLNKDYLIFYRGQAQDYRNKANKSTFYPSIYRDDNLRQVELNHRFDLLDEACRKLRDKFSENGMQGAAEARRKRYIQWSILQHYEVCSTPLLDFTQSLRVACSFAFLKNTNNEAFIYAFALPYLTNRISINSEHDLVNVRLLSICPPEALRPYFQEGYLAGTEDITNTYESKSELDFNNRLVAKFRVPTGNAFWGAVYQEIPKEWLYPVKDRVYQLCQEIREGLKTELRSGDLGEFIKVWSNLETSVIETARRSRSRLFNISEAIRFLHESQAISGNEMEQLEALRKFRNKVVHHAREIRPEELSEYQSLLEEVSDQIIKNLRKMRKGSRTTSSTGREKLRGLR